MNQIPVYTFTGFLDSGKTTFVQDTLKDPRFNDGGRILLLVCEEGEVEYDLSSLPRKNVYQVVIDDPETVTAEYLLSLEKKYRTDRVMLETNGMQLVGDFYQKMPEHWAIAQEVMFADSTTIFQYNQNMRSLVVDKLQGAGMVVFNRVPVGSDTMPFHKLARAINRRVDIVYDFTDGTSTFDEIEDPLPFDINAPVIKIEDVDYALFYRDLIETPEKYSGKTVSFLGQVAKLKREKDGMFAPGRFVMTCCEADITFMGVPCTYPGSGALPSRSWVRVTAKVEVKNNPFFKGKGPILNAISVEPASAPEQEVATF